MNRGKKQVLAAGVMLLVLLGCYVGVRQYSKIVTRQQEQEEAAKKKQVTDFAVADVTAFSYHSTGVEVSMELNGEIWNCVTEEEVEIDSEKVESFLENFSGIQSEDEITNAEDLEELGLETPSSGITFTFADGETLTCKVGNYNDVLSVYYFQTSAEDTVYTVSGTVAGKLSNTVENFEAEEEETTEEDDETETLDSTEESAEEENAGGEAVEPEPLDQTEESAEEENAEGEAVEPESLD